jgi:hypothetical protein
MITDSHDMFPANRAKQYSSNVWGNFLLVGGAIAVLLAMAGWLYFLGWLGWHFVTWIL